MIKSFKSFTENKSNEWDQWLDQQLSMYDRDPNGTLIDILTSTTEVIDQFLKSPESSTAKGTLESCLKGNSMFLDSLSSKD